MSVSQETWKPSKPLTILFGLLFQQFAFLYVNKAKLFWAYLAVALAIGFGSISFGTDNILKQAFDSGYLTILFAIICAVHASLLAQNYSDEIRHWYAKSWAVVVIAFSTLATIFVVKACFFEFFSIPSSAMSPSLNPGDHVLVEKAGFGNYRSMGLQLYRTEPSSFPERGEMIVFQYPEEPSIDFVKRVIGLPGDTIRYRNKSVFIKAACTKDGASCPDFEKIEKVEVSSDNGGEPIRIYAETIGQTNYNVTIHDMRAAPVSNYFRQPGSLQDEWIVPQGHYFVMGDNRDNSLDSRFWGFVPAENVVGRIVLSW